jgi:hypothetical protein
MFELLGNIVQQPLNYLLVANLLTEDAKLIHDGVEAKREILTDSPGLKVISPNSRLSRSVFASLT